MADIRLEIDDLALRLTVKALLEAEGHGIVKEGGALAVCDTPSRAVAASRHAAALLLAKADGVPAAVQAMRKGVFGYVFLPLAAGELGLMAQRALNGGAAVAVESVCARTLEEREGEHILEVLRQCKHNQAEAARRLGIGRNTLWRKLKRLRAGENAGAKRA